MIRIDHNERDSQILKAVRQTVGESLKDRDIFIDENSYLAGIGCAIEAMIKAMTDMRMTFVEQPRTARDYLGIMVMLGPPLATVHSPGVIEYAPGWTEESFHKRVTANEKIVIDVKGRPVYLIEHYKDMAAYPITYYAARHESVKTEEEQPHG